MALSYFGRRFLLRKSIISQSVKNYGYIILVPEIGEELPAKNFLNPNDGLPEFNNLTIEQCMAAVAKQTLDFEAAVKNIETLLEKEAAPTIFETFRALEEISAPLDSTWGLSKTLYLANTGLMPTKSYLAIHERAKRARATKFNSEVIYQNAKKQLTKSNDKRSDEETRLLEKFVLEGKLNGLDLSNEKKLHLRQILSNLNHERIQFKQKLDICTKQFSYIINDPAIMRDFPLDVLKALAQNTNNVREGRWKITLQPNIYIPTLEYCPDRDIRWNVWQALVSRGSGYGNREIATGINLEGIRNCRQDLAQLLGYNSYADMSMETKMAKSVENVQSTLNSLLDKAKPAQEQELEDLYNFAVERGFKGSRIHLWDLPYWKRKQQGSYFDYNEQNYNEYFPLERVLKGLFELCENLFDIVIKRQPNVSTWGRDATFFDIFENHTSAPIAGFYFDPYAQYDQRPKTIQNSGWMVGLRSKSKIVDTKPLAALIFNFSPPTDGNLSYLTFNEVKHLFFKFGLALQHLLSQTTYSEVSGSSNVEWDAVEISGHVLVHALYNRKVLESISSHCQTGDPLSSKMIDALKSVSKHMTGVDLSKELYLAALDIELYNSKTYWLDVVKTLWPKFRSFPLEKIDSHPCGFTQIFSEEWAAAYYSHIWSRMIAADVYSAFEEVQDDEQKVKVVGSRFRNTYLALGGSVHSSKVFRTFRGRDPSPNALLSSLGITGKTTEN